MKNRIILILALMLCTVSALAQSDGSQRFSIRLGAGLPGSGTEYFTNGTNQVTYGLAAIYGDYTSDLKASPALSAEVYYLYNDVFRFGVDLVYGTYSNQIIDGLTDQPKRTRSGQSFIVLPTAAVNYYHKGGLKLYIALGAGVGYYAGFDTMQNKLAFNVQFTPVGVEYGRKLFVFAEAGLGTAVNWLRGGVGYRF